MSRHTKANRYFLVSGPSADMPLCPGQYVSCLLPYGDPLIFPMPPCGG